MLKVWDRQFPGRLETIFTSLQNIAPSNMLDRALFDFVNLEQQRNNTASLIISDDADLDILAL
jgi:tRNA 2-thiocytidine biosynthesis protein TtcA